MLRTVQTVDDATPAEFCSPPSPGAPQPEVDSNPVLVFGTLAAIFSEDGNSLVGVIDYFDESRRYKGPTVDIPDKSSSPYPGVYIHGVGGRLHVVDDGTHAAWGIDVDPSTDSPGPAPSDLLSEDEVERRRSLADERDAKWEGTETVHDAQTGLGDGWGVEDDGENDVVPQLDPCGYHEIRSCSCCRCPGCYENAKSIRARKNKEPRYACSNSSCDTEGFEEPVRVVGLDD